MPIGTLLLGVLLVAVVVVAALVLQGLRRGRVRQGQRGDLGLVRAASPDPALVERILASFPVVDGHVTTLGGLERVTDGQPGTWHVAMVRPLLATGDDARLAMRVALVIDGLPAPSTSTEATAVAGTGGLWTWRWASELLLVEASPDAGDVARDLDAMKQAGARAVAAASTR
ncbi:MAG: hypothetical protein ABI880_00635 [Acidobacteriota bacterium]